VIPLVGGVCSVENPHVSVEWNRKDQMWPWGGGLALRSSQARGKEGPLETTADIGRTRELRKGYRGGEEGIRTVYAMRTL
jgi:hypothetical protein